MTTRQAGDYPANRIINQPFNERLVGSRGGGAAQKSLQCLQAREEVLCARLHLQHKTKPIENVVAHIYATSCSTTNNNSEVPSAYAASYAASHAASYAASSKHHAAMPNVTPASRRTECIPHGTASSHRYGALDVPRSTK